MESSTNTHPNGSTTSTPMRAAFGRELAYRRKLRGMKQASLARQLARGGWMATCSQPYLGHVETARKPPPRGMAEGADVILETNGALMRLWPWVQQETQLARRELRSGAAHGDLVDVAVTASDGHTEIADSFVMVVRNGKVHLMRRRDFLQGGAAMGGAILLGPALDTLPPEARHEIAAAVQATTTERPVRVSMRVVGHLRSLLAETRQLDDLVGPRQLLSPVEGQLAMAEQLRRGAKDEVLTALLSVTGQLAQFAGWLCLDSGDHAKASSYFDRALSLSIAANDARLGSYVLSCKSFQAYETHDPPEALLLAQAAQQPHWQPTPAVLGWALRTEGYAHALDGNADACRSALDSATEALATSTPEDEPPWIYHFRPESFPVYRGVCYADLGCGQAAIDALTEGLAALPEVFVRDRSMFLTRLADAHRLNNDLAQAGTVGQQATLLAMETGSAYTVQGLRQVWVELKGSQSVAEVREFGALLRHLT